MLQSPYQPMDYLWAPWRMPYIEDDTDDEQCIFCQLLSQEDGPNNLILFRGELSFVILNRYPYTNGHLMVVPFAHKDTIEGLPAETLAEMMMLSSQSVTTLRRTYQADAFNLGINIGTIAGAGIKDHVHIHVVPRWQGDTNFMATTARTRVLPEALEVTYNRLKEHWVPAQ
ncbi:MAG: HIT domain-containing protein [Anaerolineales bacterium]